MSISALPVCLQLPQPGLSLLCTHFPIFDLIHLGHFQWEPKHLQLCQPQLQVSLTFPHWRTTPRQTPNYLKHMSKKILEGFECSPELQGWSCSQKCISFKMNKTLTDRRQGWVWKGGMGCTPTDNASVTLLSAYFKTCPFFKQQSHNSTADRMFLFGIQS